MVKSYNKGNLLKEGGDSIIDAIYLIFDRSLKGKKNLCILHPLTGFREKIYYTQNNNQFFLVSIENTSQIL